MNYRLLYFVFCLVFLGCSFFEDSDSSSAPKFHHAEYHGSDLYIYLAVHCSQDMVCRSTLQIGGNPEPSDDYAIGFHYRLINDNDTVIAESVAIRFIDDGDTSSTLSLPVIDNHIQFSLLDSKNRHKDYDIDISPWIGHVSQTADSVLFTKFEEGAEVCLYKFQEEICNTMENASQKISIPNDSTFYSFYRVSQRGKKIEVGKYTDNLYIMTTIYWR